MTQMIHYSKTVVDIAKFSVIYITLNKLKKFISNISTTKGRYRNVGLSLESSHYFTKRKWYSN